MRKAQPFLVLFLLALLILPSSAQARYRYSVDRCDFLVTFAEAPSVKTIWPDDPMPYWEITRGFSPVGEEAVYARSYPDIGKISFMSTCVQAEKDLLDSFGQEGMYFTLKEIYAGYTIDDEEVNYTEDPDMKVKWLSMTGFHVNEFREVETISAHFIIGPGSIMIFKANLIGEEQFLRDELSDVIHSIVLK